MKIFRRILKYFLWFIGGIFVILIALYIFIQTDTFDKWASNYALNKLNNSESWLRKENYISFESISGNILKGLRVNNVVITVKKDTLVSIKYLDLKYDIWGLLKQRISLDYAVLNSPDINLTKIKDSKDLLVWNFTNLFEPSADTTSTPFNWDIYVYNFRIENGKIKILGEIPSEPLWTMQWEKQNEFNFNKLNISNFQLDMTGEYSKKFKKINLRNLSFNSNTDITLKKLAFDTNINVQDTLTEINNLVILTDRSDIKINSLSANELNLLESNAFDNFGNKKLSLVLNIDKFNFADLRYFLPSLVMLDSSVSLHLDVNGIYKNLNINNLTLKLPNSDINLNGKIKNLDNIDSLYFDVATTNKIYPEDIKTVFKNKSIPDYKNLGVVLADISYEGGLNDFYSNFNLRSSEGNVEGHTHLNIKNKNYSGNVVTNNLNLAPILKDNKLKSNINLVANFEGSGYSPNTMNAGVKYTLGSSNAVGYNIASSSGTININRNNISLNIKANSSAGNAVVTGKINISNMKNPVYTLKGTMNKVDVSRLPGNNKDKSNLNAAFDITGSGINMNNLAGKYNIDIGNSVYSKYEIPKTKLIANLDMSAETNSVQLTNNALEFKADGKYKLSSLIDAILYNISLVSNIAKKKLNSDTTINYAESQLNNHIGKVNFNYSFVTKDSAELRKISTPFGIIFNANFNGSITNSEDGFNSKTVINAQKFIYQDTVIVLNNFTGNLELSNKYSGLKNDDPLSSLKIKMDANADKLNFGKNKLDSLKADINLSDNVANFKVRGKVDSIKYARLTGAADLSGNDIVLNVDSLYVKYNAYALANNNKWNIIYNPQREVNIKQLGLISGKMVFNVNGVYSLNGSSNINIIGDNLNIGEIYAIMTPFDTTVNGERNPYPVQGELQSFNVNLQGTPADAILNLNAKTGLLKYDTISVGTILGNVKYKDEVLSPDIVVTNVGEKGVLKLTGNIPFENPFEKEEDTLNEEPEDKPAELHLAAENFQIQYFTKLVPGVGDLRGILNGKIDATGSFQNPDLKGDLTMVQGKYFLDLTGMFYDFKFKINTENSNLVINNISLYNPDDDTRHIDIVGNVDFKNYNLNNINLTTVGDMVLLDKNARENQLGLKGYLYGGIGQPPVTITGNPKKLNIKGQFLIKDASISSLPKTGKGYQADDKNMVYKLGKDSALTSDSNRRRVSLDEYGKINPFLRNRYILFDTSQTVSLFNTLAIDVSVKTVKNLYASIDFNNLTRDRLFGEITADLRIRSDSGRLRMRGDVNIVGNSYYRFYRDFKVKDSKITFHGPISKPELDIRAVYENTKATEQFGTITSSPIQVVLTVTGEPSNPEITLRLYENGTEMQGNDATSDAITFLLFGKYKNELSPSESQSVASGIGSTVGSLYVTSFVGQVVRNFIPFIKDAELNYSEGGIQNTNASISADILNADVTVGSRVIQNSSYLEFNVEYPVNTLVHLNLPEQVYLRLAREQLSRNVVSDANVFYSTGMKVLYKIKF
jgi:autotransporter translocation and assembly factor TamB